MKLEICLFELISEALGLDPNHLSDMGCADGLALLGHYYPSCPQPELTISTQDHTDNDFITILQDHIGGLKLFYQDQWTNIPPTPGALVVNAKDYLQTPPSHSETNFIVADYKQQVCEFQHKVVANQVGPRVFVAAFFTTGPIETLKVYELIIELLSEDNPVR
ncbi:hypothetical protein SSX86_021642 [Deinandra increscens subsp. villosa]|uniref:Fe2OG dioxygenase domain-containing protein n=1 Tax=Deinandra increscens subsp. villosa TaxID=3103831 RepID=A0AAP0GQ78_9ASTR